ADDREDAGAVLGDGDRILRMRAVRTIGQAQRPPVLVDGELLRGERPPRFDRQGQTGLEHESATALASVGHVRILMHRVAEAVTAEVEIDRDALSIGDVSDGLRDIAEAVARLRRADAGLEPGPGGIDRTPSRVVASAAADSTGGG